MSRLRVLLVAFTVTAVVLGTMGTAFAAGTAYSDVAADSSISGAVARLNALEILKGYPDGTFKPDNPITRAEFAAVAVRAAGLSAAATATAGQTRFSDVPAGHWAVGYINAATTAGLLLGYPDGTFKPDQQVTQAEALTILVRALGYGPVVKGEWPNNYVNQASALGLTDGVSVSANLPATRGVVAQFVDNTLETETLVQRGYGDLAFYEPSGKIFAQDKLGLKVWNRSNARVTANARIDSSLDPGEVTVTLQSDDDGIKDDFREIFGSLSVDFKLGAGLNSESILGTEVEFWAKGNTIVYAQVVTPSKRIITAYLDEDNVANGEPIEGTDAGDKWWVDEEDYKVASGASLYLNNDTAAETSFTALRDNDRAVARVVLNDSDEIAFADVWDWDHVIVVNKVDAEDDAIEGLDWKSGWDEERVEFDSPTTLDGADLDVASIEPGDIVYVIGDDYAVVKKALTGTLDEVSDKGDEVTIDGEAYDTAPGAGFSVDANDSADPVTVSNNVNEDLLDLVGEEVSYYFDAAGDVAFISGEVATTDTAIDAVAVAYGSIGSRSIITFLTEDGKLVDYETTSDTEYEDDNGTLSESQVKNVLSGLAQVNDGNFALVSFTLDDNGDLAKVTLGDYIVGANRVGFQVPGDVNEDDDFQAGSRTVKLWVNADDDKTITVPKSAKVYDLQQEDVFTGDDLVNATLANEGGSEKMTIAYTVSSGSVAETVVVYSADPDDDIEISYGFEEEDTGIVVARKFSAAGNTVTLVLAGGEKKTYGISRDDLRSLALGDVISFDTNADGDEITDFVKITTSEATGFGADADGFVGLRGADSDASVIYSVYDIGGAVYKAYTLDDDAVVVDADNDYDVVTLSQIAEDEDTVDTDFTNYEFRPVNTDSDALIEFVILRPQ